MTEDIVKRLRDNLDPEWHYIDAYRVIREQAKTDASYPALAKAVSKLVADEVGATLAAIRETHAVVPKGKLIEGQLALSNWQKYNRPDGYDEVVYQAEKMAASLSAMIAAAEGDAGLQKQSSV